MLEYWRTLVRLCTGWNEVHRALDTPLADAVVRSRWFTSWSAAVLLASVSVSYHPWWRRVWQRHMLGLLPAGARWAVVVLGVAAAVAACMCAAYGLFRMYTLVGHVLTVNVFKTRGQRLRLLNVQTVLLPLCTPAGAGIVLLRFAHILGLSVLAAVLCYAMVLLSYGYNLIFHRQGLRGFLLLIEGTLLTWFVLAIGALAIAVALAVIAFFVVLVLRAFR